MPFWRPAAGPEQFKPINRYPALKDDRSTRPECSWGGFKDVTPTFAPVRLGRERWTSGLILPRHRHEQGYIAIRRPYRGGACSLAPVMRSRPASLLRYSARSATLMSRSPSPLGFFGTFSMPATPKLAVTWRVVLPLEKGSAASASRSLRHTNIA